MPHVVLLNVFARSAVFFMRCSVCTFACIPPSNNIVLCSWSALPVAGALHEASSRGSRKRSGDGWWGHAFFDIDDATRGTACQDFMPQGTLWPSRASGALVRGRVGVYKHMWQKANSICMHRMPLVDCVMITFGNHGMLHSALQSLAFTTTDSIALSSLLHSWLHSWESGTRLD